MTNIQMKDSGIAWIGAIPKHWETARLSSLVSNLGGGNYGEDTETEKDGFTLKLPCFSISDFKWGDVENTSNVKITRTYNKPRFLNKGVILIEKSGGSEKIPVGRTILIKNKISASYSNFVHALQTTNNAEYINYLLKTTHLLHLHMPFVKQNTGLQNFYFEKFSKNILVPSPDKREQTAIANYLDHHTAKIDGEVDYLEKKATLLEEFKQSLIFETVTKGLDKSVPMKDSGIDWIGEIPEHWKVKRVKNTLKYLKKKTLPGRTDVLSLTLKGVIEKDITNNKGLNPESYDTYQEFEKDDLVFKLIDLANYQTSRVGLVWKSGIMSSAYIRLRKIKKEDYISFLYYQFFDLYNRRIFNHIGSNGVRSTLGKDELLNMPFLKTPTSEQKQIADYLDKECGIIDTKVNQYRKKAKLLKEYKQSLIYEAVTGKIEIPKEFF